MPLTSMPTAPTMHRPAWLLGLIAVPVGLVIGSLTNAFENLPQALMLLLGWLEEPSRLQRLTAALVGNVLVPGGLVFAALRLTPLGRLVAPNRLVVAALLVANGLLMFMVLYGFYQASMNLPPFLIGAAKTVVHSAATAAFSAGLGLLAVSTLWHRLVRDKQRLVSVGQRLWREY